MGNLIFVIGKKKIPVCDLKKTTKDEFNSVLEEIPSDCDSDVDDMSDDELGEENTVNIHENENGLFDINAIDVVFANEILENNENDIIFHSDKIEDEEDMWSSDDDVDLNTIRQRLLRSDTIWTTDEANYLPNVFVFITTFVKINFLHFNL